MPVDYYEPPRQQHSQPLNQQPNQQAPKPGLIRRFFSIIGSTITWLRNTLLNLVFIFIVVLIFAVLGSSAPKPLPAKFALRLAPTGLLVDQRSYMDPTSMLLGNEDPKDSETLVRDLVDAINHAAKDPRVELIVLEPAGLVGGGISKMNEIGQALTQFKAAGKKIIAASDSYSQDQYYLASFADEIYLHNMGEIELTGYGRYLSYYKTALDKLGVNVHAFRSGKYKDYLEPYLRDDMSDASREHNSAWLNSLWAAYTQQVETARKLKLQSLTEFINNLDTHMEQVQGNYAQLALDFHLVDKIVSRQEQEDLLIKAAGKADDDEHDYQGVELKPYLADIRQHQHESGDKVGLIVAEGTISDGYQPDGAIGSESFVELLRQVEDDDSIKALVIRVDSGGGSAFASEIIRAEIAALRDKGIPVYVSMGSVAASGGYWMSTAADQIWAQPTTITGSIGVFGAFPTLEKTLEKVGINSDGVGTTDLAGSMSLDRPLSPKVGAIVQMGVDHIYQRFIHLVAESRSKPVEDVDAIAQGHVWTGAKAQELGLVDQLGTLADTVAAIATQAGLKHYQLKLIEAPLSPKEAFLRELTEGNASWLAPKSLINKWASLQLLNELSPALKPLSELKQLNDPQGIYIKCLECVAP